MRRAMWLRCRQARRSRREGSGYAAGLVPQISDDIVNIDRAMRWGFAWKRGPFELIDDLGHETVIDILEASGEPLPVMLGVARDAGASTFHTPDGVRFLGLDGLWHDVPQAD